MGESIPLFGRRHFYMFVEAWSNSKPGSYSHIATKFTLIWKASESCLISSFGYNGKTMHILTPSKWWLTTTFIIMLTLNYCYNSTLCPWVTVTRDPSLWMWFYLHVLAQEAAQTKQITLVSILLLWRRKQFCDKSTVYLGSKHSRLRKILLWVCPTSICRKLCYISLVVNRTSIQEQSQWSPYVEVMTLWLCDWWILYTSWYQ